MRAGAKLGHSAPRRRFAQRLMRLIDRGQQLDVGACVALGETAPPIDRHLNPPAGRVARAEPRVLRPAQPGHHLDVAPQQAARRLTASGARAPPVLYTQMGAMVK